MAIDVSASPINLGRMGPIQIIPPGFMGLLQVKQLGQLPGTLSSVVSPVIEMRDWYMTARRVGTKALFGPNVQNTVPQTATGTRIFQDSSTGTPCTVPNGQMWYVEQASFYGFLTTAAASWHFVPMIRSAGNFEFYQVGPDYNDVPLINGRVRGFFTKADRGFWMFPGDNFAIDVLDIVTVAGESCTLDLRATVLPI